MYDKWRWLRLIERTNETISLGNLKKGLHSFNVHSFDIILLEDKLEETPS